MTTNTHELSLTENPKVAAASRFLLMEILVPSRSIHTRAIRRRPPAALSRPSKDQAAAR